MRFLRSFLFVGGLMTVAAPGLVGQQRLPVDSMELGRKYTMWFYTNQPDSLLAHMDSSFRANASVERLQGTMLEVATRAGNEVEVLEEKFITRNGARQYWRTAKMEILGEPFLLRWVITPKGEIAGIGMGPLSQAPPID